MTETECYRMIICPTAGVMYFSLFLFCDQFNVHSNQWTAQKYQLPPNKLLGFILLDLKQLLP